MIKSFHVTVNSPAELQSLIDTGKIDFSTFPRSPSTYCYPTDIQIINLKMVDFALVGQKLLLETVLKNLEKTKT